MSRNLPSPDSFRNAPEGKVRFITYMHKERDEYYPWELNNSGEPQFNDGFHEDLHYMLYEIPVEFEVDFDNKKVEIVAFWDGERRFVPE